MIINHNMNAMNAHRLMTGNTANAGKSMEKLSSGLRINRAGDDAAGLAISEKMRAQIKGLDQASRNSQDGISMLQTAEGALNETHSILQRMRELATQAGNDTNVSVDRGEIQKEMNQLSSEINRIGNTTEFNTQKLLAGDGKVAVTKTGFITDASLASGLTSFTNAVQSNQITASATAGGEKATFILNGQTITVNFIASDGVATGLTAKNVTANSVDIVAQKAAATDDVSMAIKDALNQVILNNDTLRGGYSVATDTAVGNVVITAQNQFQGSAGNIASSTFATLTANAGIAKVGQTTLAQASGTLSFGSKSGSDLVGKGMTINGKSIEFYDGSVGTYKGNAIGIDIRSTSTATNVVSALVKQANIDGVTLAADATSGDKLDVVAKQGGESGNTIKIEDGGIQKEFNATLQVGANQGQQFTMSLNDMRSIAIGITGSAGGTDSVTGSKFTAATVVTNGTDSILREASLDVSSATNATNAIKTLNNAIEKVSAERSKLGAYQNRLEHTINNLGTSSENLTSAESRVRDVDMAKEMMNFSKNNILSQASQAMLAQAKSQPEQVLQLLR